MKIVWTASRWDTWRDAMEGDESLGMFSTRELAVQCVKNDAVEVLMTLTDPVKQGQVSWYVGAILLDGEVWTEDNPAPEGFEWTVEDAWDDVENNFCE